MSGNGAIVSQRQEILAFLLRRRLVSRRALVSGDVVLSDVSRRNRNYKVTVKGGPCYLLKQGVGTDRSATVAHEAAVYRHYLSRREFAALRRYVPSFVSYDSTHRILVTRLIGEWESLAEFQDRRRRFSRGTAARIGEALATLHRLSLNHTGEPGNSRVLLRWPPWILTLHRPDLDAVRDCSAGGLEVIRIIQRFPEFGQRMDALRQDWNGNSIIHGDVKFDNLVKAMGPDGRRQGGLRIVDWELASLGDAAWDVGSVFGEYLTYWLFSIPITGDLPPKQLMESIRYPLREIRPAIRAFWRAYVRRSGMGSARSRARLLRATELSGVRLAQTAFERVQGSMQITPNIVCLMQLSLNLMRRPRETQPQLFGIPVLAR